MIYYLAIVIFIVPFGAALYIWRDKPPKQSVYYLCFSVSILALIMVLMGSTAIAAVMPIGLFLASTSFFAGLYLSGIVRRYRELKKERDQNGL